MAAVEEKDAMVGEIVDAVGEMIETAVVGEMEAAVGGIEAVVGELVETAMVGEKRWPPWER